MLQLRALFKQPERQEIQQKRCYLTKSNCMGHIKVQICLGDLNPLLPKSVPFCCCPATWLHHPVSPQPPPLPSCPSRKKSLTRYHSGKTLSLLEMSSEERVSSSALRAASAASLLPPAPEEGDVHGTTLLLGYWLRSSSTYPSTASCSGTQLEGPGAMAQLGTSHSWSLHAARQPRQGTEGLAGCSNLHPPGGLCPCWLQDRCFQILYLKINR